MERVPNWYRWLLIAGATIIMCACRAPLIAPSLADVPLVATIASESAPPIESADTASQRNHQVAGREQVESSHVISGNSTQSIRAGRALRLVHKAIRREGNLDWWRSDSSSVIAPEPHGRGPVVRKSGSGAERQRVAGQVTTGSGTSVDAGPSGGGRSRFQASGVAPAKPSWLAQQLSGSWASYGQDDPNALQLNDDEEQRSPFVDDPAPVVEDPIAEFEHEKSVGEEFIDHGQMIPPDARPPWWDYPDEYICDGCDSNSAVQVLSDWSVRNLDPEDTVGHFDTLDGRVVVQPSNRICIYAPRFAATRKVTAAYESEMPLQPATAEAPLVAVTHQRRQGSDLLSQNLSPEHHLAIQPATVFKERLPAAEALQRQSLILLTGDLPAHEDFRVIRIGVHRQAEKARLAEFAEAAVGWSHDTAVQVVMENVAAQTRVTAAGVEEFFSLAQGSPKLRVIKTASCADALPGEVIEFTLRFDNVGHQVIRNVTIIDNLTTRLEYIQKTAECSVDAEFSADTNDAESLTLRWEIAEPLDLGEGGIIRFKCRVR